MIEIEVSKVTECQQGHNGCRKFMVEYCWHLV